MAKEKNLYGLVEYVNDNDVSLQKAATDYEIGGALTRTDAINLFDTVRKQGDIVSKIRVVPVSSNTGNLNQFVNNGVLVGRAAAGTAKAALNAGNDIANINKANIGNAYVLKEFYFLFNLLHSEVTNFARLGRGKFNSEVARQFSEDYKDTLENMLFTGDNGVNQPNNLLALAKANLGDGSTGLTVRNVDTAAMTTITEKLVALRDLQSNKYRKEVVYLMSVADYDTYTDEVDATTNYNGAQSVTKSKEYTFDGRPVLRSPYCPDDNILVSPLNNIVMVVNIGGVQRDIEVMKIPNSIIYSIVSSWDFGFITYDKCAIAYDQTP